MRPRRRCYRTAEGSTTTAPGRHETGSDRREAPGASPAIPPTRSGERRGGEEGRSRGAPRHLKKKKENARRGRCRTKRGFRREGQSCRVCCRCVFGDLLTRRGRWAGSLGTVGRAARGRIATVEGG